jgi:dienelactone hydrolase
MAMPHTQLRIANDGYYVLLPDLFYRVEFDASQGMKVFTDPDLRKDLMTRVLPSASSANIMRDTEALLAHLSTQREARSERIGITGYCTEAGVDHTVETYDALHGFVPRDTPVHDEAATARHWKTLLELFATTLKSTTRDAKPA